MTESELISRLTEIQVSLVDDFRKPGGLSEGSRKEAMGLLLKLKSDIKPDPAHKRS